MKYHVRVADKTFHISIDGNQPAAIVNGRKVIVDHRRLRGGKVHSLLADNANFEFEIERSNGGLEIWHGCRRHRVEVEDEKTARLTLLMGKESRPTGPSVLKAPMPGVVLKVEVRPGQNVKKNDGVVVVEAMKMENELKAHAEGVVKEVKVKPGDAVEKDQVLVVFE